MGAWNCGIIHSGSFLIKGIIIIIIIILGRRSESGYELFDLGTLSRV